MAGCRGLRCSATSIAHLAGAIALGTLSACDDDGGGGGPAFVEPAPWIGSDRHLLRDEVGRVVVLRGANARVDGVFDVELDGGRLPVEEVPAFGADDARRMRALGFSVLRLPISWSGVEPREGEYDGAYLERVAQVVAECAAAGIHVIIDFHQDAYSKEIGEDGAPLWAIVPPPTMLLGGPLGDSLTARRASQQVLDAFDSFFVNDDDDLADERLQAAFAAMAAHVAGRFADEPWVLGYDLFNEPTTLDVYLPPFHRGVSEAIRAVDARHLLLFEPAVSRQFIGAPLAEAPFPDPGGVYAPHVYTPASAGVGRAELAPNLEAAVAEARSFDVPLFVGEWGVGPDDPVMSDYVRLTYDLFDEHLASATVWLWKESSQGSWGFFEPSASADAWTERDRVFAAHARVYAERIAGEPIEMRYDAEALRFELRYLGRDDDAPSRLRVPAPPDFPASFVLRCNTTVVAPQPVRDPLTGTIDVVCAGAGEQVVELSAQ